MTYKIPKVTVETPKVFVRREVEAPTVDCIGNCSRCGLPVHSTGGHPTCWQEAVEESNEYVEWPASPFRFY